MQAKLPVNLSSGRIVFHRPAQNGATEAYLLNGECMTNTEWTEYCRLTAPKAAPVKRTWAQIKADQRMN
jgi:hypothetical protein